MIIEILNPDSNSLWSVKALIKCDYCLKDKAKFISRNQNKHYCSKDCYETMRKEAIFRKK